MKIRIIFILISVFLMFSCISETKQSRFSNSQVYISNFQKDSTLTMEELTGIYDSINEPRLDNVGYEYYRFNYLDSFGSHKLFRIEHRNKDWNKLIVKFYESSENVENSYNITHNATYDLTLEQYETFKKLIDGSYFWSLKMFEDPLPQYLDGYGYVLEGFQPWPIYEKKRYHIVSRIVPHDGSFKQACELLIDFFNQEKTKN